LTKEKEMGMLNILAGGYMGLKSNGSRRYALLQLWFIITMPLSIILGVGGFGYSAFIAGADSKFGGLVLDWGVGIGCFLTITTLTVLYSMMFIDAVKSVLADLKATSKRNNAKKSRYT
jgi:hypothetical protein